MTTITNIRRTDAMNRVSTFRRRCISILHSPFYILHLFLLFPLGLWAQTDTNPHRVSLYVEPMWSSLRYGIKQDFSPISVGVGADYSYFFTPMWGVSGGLRYASYTGIYTFDNVIRQTELMSDGEPYTLIQRNSQTEKQRYHSLEIPILARFQYNIHKQWSITAGLGVVAGFRLAESVKINKGNYSRTANFTNLGIVIDDFPEKGLGQYNDFLNPEATSSIKGAFGLMAEVGADYRINSNWSAFAAVNFGYGFAAFGRNTTAFVEDNRYNPAAVTDYFPTINPISCGLKIGVTYHFGVKKKNVVAVAAPVTPVEAPKPDETAPKVEVTIDSTAAPVRRNM